MCVILENETDKEQSPPVCVYLKVYKHTYTAQNNEKNLTAYMHVICSMSAYVTDVV